MPLAVIWTSMEQRTTRDRRCSYVVALAHAPSPEERLLKEEEVGRVLDAVAALGGADRELISLRYGSGLEIAEMAEILGLGPGTVRTRLWRALGRLRKVLDDE